MQQPIQTPEEYEAAMKRALELIQKLPPEEAQELVELIQRIIGHVSGFVFFKDGKEFVNEISLDFSGGANA
jgi:hypothetical protein